MAGASLNLTGMRGVGRTSLISVFLMLFNLLVEHKSCKLFLCFVAFFCFSSIKAQSENEQHQFHGLILTYLLCRPFLSSAFQITRLYSREKVLGINYAITMRVLRGQNIKTKRINVQGLIIPLGRGPLFIRYYRTSIVARYRC